MSPYAHAETNIKKPNVSGQFYPGTEKDIRAFMDEAWSRAGSLEGRDRVEVLVSPHAGYRYSGWVAAFGYKSLEKSQYSTIIMIGPSHFHSYAGASIWPKGQFETPLGLVPVDEELAAKLMAIDKDLTDYPTAFSPEHSLEVQLPFIQRDFPNAKIVPILMGNPEPAVCINLAKAINEIVGSRKDILVLISTDLSHYHPASVARPMDLGTIKTIIDKDVEGFWQGISSGKMEACGFTSVATGMLYAKMRGLNGVELLRYANSGDATGDNSKVVGYSSIVFYSTDSKVHESNRLNQNQKKELIHIARRTLEALLNSGKKFEPTATDERLKQVQGAFVTLKKHGQLRGCIGNIIGEKSLFLTVRDMAIAAASQDPRFPAVKADELAEIEVEVSVLSVPTKINDPQNNIQLGTHGVIVSRGMFNRGVFLPQVATETGWDLERFMGELCSQKAGMPRDCWKDPKTTIEVFTADVFSEQYLK